MSFEKAKKVGKTISPEFSLEVKDLFLKVLKKTRMEGAVFFRVYDDATCLTFSSNPFLPEYVFKQKVHIAGHAPEHLIQDRFCYFAPKNPLYREFHNDLKARFNWGSFVNYIEKHVGYFDMVSFGSRNELEVAANDYLNLKEEMAKFCGEFKDNVKVGSLESREFRAELSEEMLPNFKGLSGNSDFKFNVTESQSSPFRYDQANSRYFFQMPGSSEYFTQREYSIFTLVVRGMTGNQIAQNLGLSVRTIEQYIERIKYKLQCRSKFLITQTALELGLVSGLSVVPKAKMAKSIEVLG